MLHATAMLVYAQEDDATEDNDTKELEEVVVMADDVSRINKSAFNVVAISTDGMRNSTKSLSDALAKIPGLNVQGTGTTRMAIFKGDTREFRYVTGLPAPDDIASFSRTPYTENGCCYTTVVTTGGAMPTIYRIDPKTATATAGLTVEADEIGAIGRLKSY